MQINYQKVELILAKKLNELTIENVRLQALLDDYINECSKLTEQVNQLTRKSEDE